MQKWICFLWRTFAACYELPLKISEMEQKMVYGQRETTYVLPSQSAVLGSNRLFPVYI